VVLVGKCVKSLISDRRKKQQSTKAVQIEKVADYFIKLTDVFLVKVPDFSSGP
jgi:hypothetical protein